MVSVIRALPSESTPVTLQVTSQVRVVTTVRALPAALVELSIFFYTT
jgi:hypothetical protein